MKKTGLADSPLFMQPTEEHQATRRDAPRSERKSEGEADSPTARQHAVTTANQHDSTTVRQHDSISKKGGLSAYLDAKATNKTTLRYPPSLMGELDDLIYQIKKSHGVTLSKNAIFVLALAYILTDFKAKSESSLLFKHLIQPAK